MRRHGRASCSAQEGRDHDRRRRPSTRPGGWPGRVWLALTLCVRASYTFPSGRPGDTPPAFVFTTGPRPEHRPETDGNNQPAGRSEEQKSELQSLKSISYAVFCLKTQKRHITKHNSNKE